MALNLGIGTFNKTHSGLIRMSFEKPNTPYSERKHSFLEKNGNFLHILITDSIKVIK